MVIYFNSMELREAILEAGYKQIALASEVKCGKSTISNCLCTGKINPALLDRICKCIGRDPADFRYGQVAKRKSTGKTRRSMGINDLSPLTPLTAEAVESLTIAIIEQAKKDYIRLYKMAVKKKTASRWQMRSSGNSSLERIENELTHPDSYFRNQIIGNIADPDKATSHLLRKWRNEALKEL